jgi:hypothetical protein
MSKNSGPLLSRRQFARRAAVLSATASIVPATTILSESAASCALPGATNSPQLSASAQLEVDSRYQQILSLYGQHLDESQKAHIKTICVDLQPTLEKIRKFKLDNGNAPALFLKPMVERDKKPQSAAAAKKS